MDRTSKQITGSILPALGFVLLMWSVKLMEWVAGVKLHFLGVLPRHVAGLPGILLSPLVHGDLMHLLSNTFSLIILSGMIFFLYAQRAWSIHGIIYLASGLWLWCFGREVHHIGASGLIYGFAGFLFFSGIFGKERGGMAVSMAVLVLYSGLLRGIFPQDPGVSWEAHLTGGLAGMLTAFYYRKKSKPFKKRYPALEEEDEQLNHLALHVYNPYKQPEPPARKSLRINYVVVPADKGRGQQAPDKSSSGK